MLVYQLSWKYLLAEMRLSTFFLSNSFESLNWKCFRLNRTKCYSKTFLTFDREQWTAIQLMPTKWILMRDSTLKHENDEKKSHNSNRNRWRTFSSRNSIRILNSKTTQLQMQFKSRKLTISHLKSFWTSNIQSS